ncbi:hypothetical protein C8F01DRAFT_1261356 [Mycena amicta]|nr:hypothetical protein C8F01DRAFT_1261356 [Mycena amicta]
MSSHAHYPSNPGSDSTPKRMRTAVACINCRRRKRKCVPAEDSSSNACTRCQMHNIVCEYPAPNADELALAGHLQLQEPYSYPYASNSSSSSRSHSYYPGQGQSSYPVRPGSTAPPPAWPSSAPTMGQYGEGGSGPALPYTGPPPPHTRPRYSNGTPYPNLALEGDQQQSQGQQGHGQSYGYQGYTGAANPYNPYQQR